MIKFDKKVKMIFSMLLILLMCIFCQKSYAILPKGLPNEISNQPANQIVSYGIGIFLTIWQWFQYIFPVLLTLVLILINRKKLNSKKIIISIIVGFIIFGACYFTGELVLKNSIYYGYSSGRMDIIKYNGKSVYVHK